MEDAPNPQNKLNNDAVSSSKSSTTSLYPTARSLSVITAPSTTDPNYVPTALSNSTTTAVGATPSEFDRHSGMSDTSAGSSLNSNKSNTNTAKSPKTSELILNDLRRGSVFGRQSQPISQSSETNGPQSVTNITFSNNTTFSTASQLTESDASAKEIKVLTKENMEKELNESPGKRNKSRILEKLKNNKEKKITSKGVLSKKSTGSQMSSMNDCSMKSETSKKLAKPVKIKKEENENESKFSTKSKKSGKCGNKPLKLKRRDGLNESVSRKQKKSEKSRILPPSETNDISKGKSQKKPMKPQPKTDISKKSDCARSAGISWKSTASKKLKKQENPSEMSKSIRKVEKTKESPGTNESKMGEHNIDGSVRLADRPTVPNGAQYVAKPAEKQGKFSQSTYLFPGAGKCTRNFDTVAPISPRVEQMEDQCVYDISKLSSTRRQMPPPKPEKKKPRSLFDNQLTKQVTRPVLTKVKKPAQPSISATSPFPSGNKVVVYGTTPDGKHQVEFTIHMRLVSGEALGLSNEPIEMVPRKVIIGGKEIPVDLPKKPDTNTSAST